MPNFEETHYDELELATDFNLYYVVFSDLGNFLKKNISDGMIDVSIGREMLYVFEVYQELYGGF